MATAAQVCSDALERPACGLPTTTTTITAAVSKLAQIHSPLLIVRCDNLALSGSAKSSESVRSACTSSTEPWPNAAACNAMLVASSSAPYHQR